MELREFPPGYAAFRETNFPITSCAWKRKETALWTPFLERPDDHNQQLPSPLPVFCNDEWLGNFPKNEWDTGAWLPQVIKLGHLHPVKTLLFIQIFNFCTFILGSPFLLPQRANNQKREFSKLQTWMKQRGFSARGIQTWSFSSCWDTFVHTFFQLLHFHTEEPILITPEGQ